MCKGVKRIAFRYALKKIELFLSNSVPFTLKNVAIK